MLFPMHITDDFAYENVFRTDLPSWKTTGVSWNKHYIGGNIFGIPDNIFYFL